MGRGEVTDSVEGLADLGDPSFPLVAGQPPPPAVTWMWEYTCREGTFADRVTKDGTVGVQGAHSPAAPPTKLRPGRGAPGTVTNQARK